MSKVRCRLFPTSQWPRTSSAGKCSSARSTAGLRIRGVPYAPGSGCVGQATLRDPLPTRRGRSRPGSCRCAVQSVRRCTHLSRSSPALRREGAPRGIKRDDGSRDHAVEQAGDGRDLVALGCARLPVRVSTSRTGKTLTMCRARMSAAWSPDQHETLPSRGSHSRNQAWWSTVNLVTAARPLS